MDGRELNIYNTLLGLPLFQGMSKADLEDVTGHTRFEFCHFDKDEAIVKSGNECIAMWFLTSGVASALSASDDNSYSVEEQMSAPAMFQAEPLFGLTQRFTQTVTALSRCDLLLIGKSEVIRLMGAHDIFRTNLMNILTTRSQRLLRRPWRTVPRTLRESIVRMFSDRCLHPAGAKTFHIGMQQIADLTSASRLNVSRELHAMEREGLIVLNRQHIYIPALESLYV